MNVGLRTIDGHSPFCQLVFARFEITHDLIMAAEIEGEAERGVRQMEEAETGD